MIPSTGGKRHLGKGPITFLQQHLFLHLKYNSFIQGKMLKEITSTPAAALPLLFNPLAAAQDLSSLLQTVALTPPAGNGLSAIVFHIRLHPVSVSQDILYSPLYIVYGTVSYNKAMM